MPRGHMPRGHIPIAVIVTPAEILPFVYRQPFSDSRCKWKVQNCTYKPDYQI